MRLIAGKYKGRLLSFPPASITRPTSDRARQAIFNILMHDPEVCLKGAHVMDMFAGSGAMGLEALSRGAQQIIFIESNPVALSVIKENVQKLGAEGETHVIQGDAMSLSSIVNLGTGPQKSLDLVFLDPPYEKGFIEPTLQNLLKNGWVSEKTLVVTEVPTASIPEQICEGFVVDDQRTYGAATFLFLRRR